jgi:hypothetical protein
MKKCKYSNSKCTDCKLCEPEIELNEEQMIVILNIIESEENKKRKDNIDEP